MTTNKVPDVPKGIKLRQTKKGPVYDATVSVKGKPLHLGTRDTIDAALALRHAYFERMKNAGQPVPADTGVLTVRQLGELCMGDAPRDELNRWKRVCVTAPWIDWPATQVSTRDGQLWVAGLVKTQIASGKNKGLLPTRGTVQWMLTIARRVFAYGTLAECGYLTTNPFVNVTIRNSTQAKPRRSRNAVFDYLREDDALRLLNAPASRIGLEPHTKFLVLMFSGARPGDLWRLRWEDVDWTARTIVLTSRKTSDEVWHQYTQHMIPRLESALLEWHLACGRKRKGLVFPSPTGGVYSEGYDAGWADKRERRHRTWKLRHTGDKRRSKSTEITVTPGYRTKLGIVRDVPLYCLRHTCASHLLLGSEAFTGGRRWTREEIQAHLGHKTPDATERYMRSLGLAGRKAAEESRAALRKGRKPR